MAEEDNAKLAEHWAYIAGDDDLASAEEIDAAMAAHEEREEMHAQIRRM